MDVLLLIIFSKCILISSSQKLKWLKWLGICMVIRFIFIMLSDWVYRNSDLYTFLKKTVRYLFPVFFHIRQTQQTKNYDEFLLDSYTWQTKILLKIWAQSAGAIKYADCISEEGEDSLPTSVLDMAQNHLMVRFQFLSFEGFGEHLHCHYYSDPDLPSWLGL